MSPGRPVIPRRGESSFCRPLLRGFIPQWTFPMGRQSPRHGAAVRGRTQKFLTPAAKSFVAGTPPPGRLKRDVVTSAPGKSAAGNRPQRWRQEGKSLTPRKGCGERRHRRDNGGATAPVAANRGFRHQTVAKPETAPAGSAEPGRCASSCPAESGLTTGCRQAAGSRRCPCAPGRQNNRHHTAKTVLIP